MKRIRVDELMDQAAPDSAFLAESLRDLAWANRYLGGTPTVLHQLRRLLRGYEAGELRVLDVGAGGGDILKSVAGWCSGRGLRFDGTALDFGAETVRLAAAELREGAGAGHGRMAVVRADARRLPFGDGELDVAISNTFLHHLDAADAVKALSEMARVSRWGVIVSDLRRTLGGYLSTWLLAQTVWKSHPYARHDGPVSMKAAYTLREAAALAREAGLDAAIDPQPGFRWALRWSRPR